MFRSAQSASSRAMKSVHGSGVSMSRAIDEDELMTPSSRKVMQGGESKAEEAFWITSERATIFQVPLTAMRHPVRGSSDDQPMRGWSVDIFNSKFPERNQEQFAEFQLPEIISDAMCLLRHG